MITLDDLKSIQETKTILHHDGISVIPLPDSKRAAFSIHCEKKNTIHVYHLYMKKDCSDDRYLLAVNRRDIDQSTCGRIIKSNIYDQFSFLSKRNTCITISSKC